MLFVNNYNRKDVQIFGNQHAFSLLERMCSYVWDLLKVMTASSLLTKALTKSRSSYIDFEPKVEALFDFEGVIIYIL